MENNQTSIRNNRLIWYKARSITKVHNKSNTTHKCDEENEKGDNGTTIGQMYLNILVNERIIMAIIDTDTIYIFISMEGVRRLGLTL